MRELQRGRERAAAHNCTYSRTAGGAGSYLPADDLQDYVTDNMRGILKSEEKRNVLDRERERKTRISSMLAK